MTDENKTDPRYVNRMVSARAQGGVPVRPDRVLDITVPPRPSPPVFDSRLLDSPFLSRVERQALREAMGSPTLVSAYTDLVREDESVLLLDDGALGPDFHAARPMRPFPEHDGEYGGPPIDGAAACDELERMRSAGATCLLLAFPALWWLEAYPELERHLEQHARCRSASARARVYELLPVGAAGAGS